MSASSFSKTKDFKRWDQGICKRNPHYVLLYEQMSAVAKNAAVSNDIDFWWRYTVVTFGFTNSLNPEKQLPEVLAKLREAARYAEEKVLRLVPKHFVGHLMLTKALLETITLTLVDEVVVEKKKEEEKKEMEKEKEKEKENEEEKSEENTVKKPAELVEKMWKHLQECVTQKYSLWQVVLLECQVHLCLSALKEKCPEAAKRTSPALKSASVMAHSLRGIVYFAGNSLELYSALVACLHREGRLNEALCIAAYTLKLERPNEKEAYQGRVLRRLKGRIARELREQQREEKRSKSSKH